MSDWINFNRQEDAKTLSTNTSSTIKRFKVYTKPLYRGTFISQAEIVELQKTKKIRIPKFSSWTKDERVARRAIVELQPNIKGQLIPIILKKTFAQSDVVIDIDAFVEFFGQDRLEVLGLSAIDCDIVADEKEVLIKPTTITKNDILSLI